jgi:YD repeat-containing protein
MKKTLFIMAAALFATVSASAQEQYPTEYMCTITALSEGTGSFFGNNYCDVWDEVVRGKPGQGLGLVAPGAKIVKSKIETDGWAPFDWEHEFYPNGLMKAQKGPNNSYTYNYDKQWRLKNVIDKDNKVVRTYNYDANGKLTKTICYDGDYSKDFIYKYDASGNLIQINRDDVFVIEVKGNNIVKSTQQYYEDIPATFKYDAQNRWIASTYITCYDQEDVVFWGKDELKLNYAEGTMPTSVTIAAGYISEETYPSFQEKPENKTYRCTYTYDDHKNWTTWKATGTESTPWTITRTISYYTDEEVKQALAEMEAARKAPSQKKEEKEEELWSF